MRRSGVIITLLIISFSSVQILSAQSGYRLRIVSESGHNPLGDVICRLYDARGKSLGYRISSNQGTLVLSVDSLSTVELSKMGYETKKVQIHPSAEYQEIVLKEKVTKLKEVVIRAEAISKQSDTIRYNASRFKGDQDRYLEDLLAKLPGLTVQDNGKIQYQGRNISKLYIEGQDLLGSGYGVATQTIPADGVSEIQVLENHQHIRRLKGKVHEERAALNVRLKKNYRSRLIGDVLVGLSDVDPLRGRAEAKLSRFGANNQLMVVPQLNNMGLATGVFAADEQSYANYEVQAPNPNMWLDEGFDQIPNLDLRRYLDNRTGTASVNWLSSLDTVSTLKFNLMALEEQRKQLNSEEYRFGGVESLMLRRDKSQVFRNQRYSLETNYEVNSLNTYLLNRTIVDYKQRSFGGDIQTNAYKDSQYSRGRSLLLTNNLGTNAKLLGKEISFKSLVQYALVPEELNLVHRLDSEENLVATYDQREFTLNHHIGTAWHWKKFRLSVGIGEKYSKKKYWFGEYGSSKKDLQIYVSPELNYYYSDGRIGLELRPLYRSVELQSSVARQEKSLWAWQPSFSWRHDISSRWELGLRFNYAKDVADSDYPLLGLLPVSYWSYVAPLAKVYANRVGSVSSSLRYRDPSRALFARIQLSYTARSQEYIYHTRYSEDRQERMAVNHNNTRETISVGLGIDKSWVDAKATVKYDVVYQRSRYELMQNEVYSNVMAQAVGNRFNVIVNPIQWLNIKGNVQYDLTHYSNNLYGSGYVFSAIKGNLSLGFSVSKIWGVKSQLSAYANEIDRGQWRQGIFVDAEAYWLSSKRIELSLKCSNLAGVKSYEERNLTDINSYYFNMPLRGREMMLELRCKL